MSWIEDDGRPCPMQRSLKHDPWKLLVGCLMLNRTSKATAFPVLEKLFDEAPTPQSLLAMDYDRISEILRPCGLWRRRTGTLIAMTQDWVNHVSIYDMRGVGRYALDSYEIFVFGTMPNDSSDKELVKYLATLQK